MNAVLELDKTVVRRGGRAVLQVEHLSVIRGEVLAIIGPNGAGKSTLLRILGLLDRPTEGTVHFRGEVVDWRSPLVPLRRRMASAFQEPWLCDATAFANVALGLRFRGLPSPAIRERAGHWLARFGVGHLANRQARTLSGGEAQRVALARALVLEPEVLFLDEPFSSLDQPTREALVDDLGMILRQDHVTTVFVTHAREEALALGDRVAVMMDGQILQVDAPTRLFRAPISERVARFVGVETILEGRVVGQQEGIAVVEVEGQKIEVACRATPGATILFGLRPEDFTLASPEGLALASSARNHLLGTIVRLHPSGALLRAVVNCGFFLTALVTRQSAESLGLEEGGQVLVAFKATAPHVLRADLDKEGQTL